MSAQNDAAFLRMFLLVLGALVAFTVIIMIAANMISGPLKEVQAGDPMRRAAVEQRIAPVGQVAVAGAAQGGAAAPAPAARSGAEVYQAVCMACHATGAAGAPKVGDQAAWQPRVGAGMDALVQTVITGKGAMPPRGGQPATTDDEIRAAIQHMLQETGLEAAGGAAPASAATAVTEAAGAAAAAVESAAAAVTEAATAAAASVSEAVAPAGEAGVDLAKGEQIYQSACFACHGTGAAGAPKLGDTADWAPRIAQGSETLLQHAINGFQGKKGVMPPKGGRVDLSDADVTAAIAYMVSKSQ